GGIRQKMMDCKQLSQESVFTRLCHGMFKTDLNPETFLSVQKRYSATDRNLVSPVGRVRMTNTG
ncbi:MAG: hypothetical protein KH811_08730, partial [Veillonella sp.]|nr:hypothetical protein [Veillonella sp.]